MQSKEDSIQKVALAFLNEKKIKFTKLAKATFYGSSDPQNELGLDLWVVPYEYVVFQAEEAYIYIDDISQKVLQVLTKHGIKYNTLNA